MSSPTPGTPEERPTPPRLVGRRTHSEPRYAAFIATGAVVGLVAAVVLTFSRPEDGASYASVLGYLAFVLAAAGGLLGGTVAAVLGFVIDRRHRPR